MPDRFISPELFAGDDEDSEEESLADSTLRPLPSLDNSLIAYLASRGPPPDQPGLEVDAPSDTEDNLPLLDTDGPVQSSPVVGTREERQAIRRRKASNKQKKTVAKRQEEAKELEVRQLEEDFEDVLNLLNQKGRRFGQLLKYVFDPSNAKGNVRWHEFFAFDGEATNILDWWVSSKNSETARNEVKEWAVQYVSRVVGDEARKVTKSKVLQTREKVIDQDFVRSFRFSALNTTLKELAPVGMRVLDKFSTSRHAQEKHTERRKERTKMVSLSLPELNEGAYNHVGRHLGCPHLPWRIQPFK